MPARRELLSAIALGCFDRETIRSELITQSPHVE
jgi:hypothetical protein